MYNQQCRDTFDIQKIAGLRLIHDEWLEDRHGHFHF